MQTLLDRRAAELHPGATASENTCRCGQPLDFCTASHCPRCGIALHAH